MINHIFDDASALIMAEGNHKPDKAVIADLNVLPSMRRQGRIAMAVMAHTKARQTRADQQMVCAICTGSDHVIDCNLYNEQQRQRLLRIQAQQFGLTLSQEAWQLLMYIPNIICLVPIKPCGGYRIYLRRN